MYKRRTRPRSEKYPYQRSQPKQPEPSFYPGQSPQQPNPFFYPGQPPRQPNQSFHPRQSPHVAYSSSSPYMSLYSKPETTQSPIIQSPYPAISTLDILKREGALDPSRFHRLGLTVGDITGLAEHVDFCHEGIAALEARVTALTRDKEELTAEIRARAGRGKNFGE
ncbi:hypothetical protein EJ08DRAFT_738321 [Tothia fuscella]|uniref:Uncharacterized protein n=1 Tax=Tothia fuscella TaxID=1048955 RepID=A0A9P4NH33_9PEZI|nr:hypothetical protein EJ08DRAFT_738321 [Tothia fuscella]